MLWLDDSHAVYTCFRVFVLGIHRVCFRDIASIESCEHREISTKKDGAELRENKDSASEVQWQQ